MTRQFLTSRTSVIAPNSQQVYVVESDNPEKILTKRIRNFLQSVGFSELFPHFKNIRVSTVHPFITLLAQDVLGVEQKVNVFPAVTVVDSSLQEDAEVLGDNYVVKTWNAEDIATLDGYRQAGEVFVSDPGWEKIINGIGGKEYLISITKQYHTSHVIDLNVWSENKEVTDFLFDMMCHFVTQSRIDVHNKDGLDMQRITGRRSGDINLDFGKLLYGSNVSLTASLNYRTTVFDLSVNRIEDIDTSTFPQYFILGGE